MILVTGATGFLGSELAKQLAEKGEHIRCTKLATSVVPALLIPYNHLIEWVIADILNATELEQAFNGINQVYHCAAYVSLKEADREKMIHTNIKGTAHVVNLCLQKHIRLVHVSSIAAIGKAKPGKLITEDDQLNMNALKDGYAISKIESELEVWRGIDKGLDAVIINPSLIIGVNVGTKGNGQFFEIVRKGLKFYTAGSVGFVDVEDVAKCMIALMNSDLKAERYIINAENLNYKNLTAMISRGFNMPAPSIFARPWMMEIAWRVAALISKINGKAPFVDKVAAQAASAVKNFDNSKIKKAIGFEFKPMSQSVNEICKRLAK